MAVPPGQLSLLDTVSHLSLWSALSPCDKVGQCIPLVLGHIKAQDGQG